MAKLTSAQAKKQLEEMAKKRRSLAPAFANDTPEKKKARIDASAKNVFVFAQIYCPHYLEDETPAFHRDLAADAEVVGRLVIDEVPRGGGKSTVVTFLKPLHWGLHQLRKLMVIGSDTADQAEIFLSFIIDELEDNERIIADFGEQKNPGNWTDGDIVLRNGVRIVTRGKGEKVRGLRNGPHRPDAFIGDDIENDEEQNNPRRVEKTVRWVRRQVLPAMTPKGYTAIIVGTRLSRHSALARLADEKHEDTGEPLYLHRRISAISRDPDTGERISFWPSRFPLAYLDDFRSQIGSQAFWAEMMNDPKDEEGAFREEWIVEVPAEVEAPSHIVIANDPSLGETTKHDDKATVALGARGKYVDTLLCRSRKESVDAMITALFDAYETMRDRYPSATIRVVFDATGFQEFLLYPIRDEEARRGYHLPVKQVKLVANKMARIESLSSPVERGLIRFARKQGDQARLIEQLLYLEQKTVNDDAPDALEMAYRELQTMTRRSGFVCTPVVRRRTTLGGGSYRHDLAEMGR